MNQVHARRALTGLTIAVTWGAMIIAGSTPLMAQVAGAKFAAGAEPLVQDVQYRHYNGRYYYHRHRGWGAGPAVGAGIAGFAAGAIIGGALARPHYYEPAPYYAPAPYYGPSPYGAYPYYGGEY